VAAKTKPIIVTISDDGLKDIQGMRVSRVLPVTGVICGSSPSGKMPALRKVTGVSSVEEEASAELPPPDSKLQ
jgi:hypothetical protein